MKNDLFYLSWYTVRTKSTRGREVRRFGQSILDEAALDNILLASHGSEKSASKALAGISHADVDRLLGSVESIAKRTDSPERRRSCPILSLHNLISSKLNTESKGSQVSL